MQQVWHFSAVFLHNYAELYTALIHYIGYRLLGKVADAI